MYMAVHCPSFSYWHKIRKSFELALCGPASPFWGGPECAVIQQCIGPAWASWHHSHILGWVFFPQLVTLQTDKKLLSPGALIIRSLCSANKVMLFSGRMSYGRGLTSVCKKSTGPTLSALPSIALLCREALGSASSPFSWVECMSWPS